MKSPRQSLIEQYNNIKHTKGGINTNVFTEAGYCLQYPAPLQVFENLRPELVGPFYNRVLMIITDVLNYEG